jgi:hypothetical protein
MKDNRHIRMARAFHEAYEKLAPRFGYKTREESAVPWNELPEANRELMIATASLVLCSMGWQRCHDCADLDCGDNIDGRRAAEDHLPSEEREAVSEALRAAPAVEDTEGGPEPLL